MPINIPQNDRRTLHVALPLQVISGITITAMIIPILIVDLSTSVYHAIYFRINGIPLIPRSHYIILDRGRLQKLNWVQRWNCVYCDYANGMVAWTKAVINTTEVYNCAIKHGSAAHNQDYQKDYFEYDRFR